MFLSHRRAIKTITQQIDELSMERIAPRRLEIEQAIKFMYWQGSFNKKIYEKMNNLLTDKYTEVMNKYYNDFITEDERKYQLFLKRNNLDEGG